MIRLDDTTTTLEVILAGAKTTLDANCYASFYDVPARTKMDYGEYQGATNTTDTNGIAAVTLVLSPAANTVRNIEYVSVHNYDSAAITATVQVNENGTVKRLHKDTLNAGQTLTWSRGGIWQVL